MITSISRGCPMAASSIVASKTFTPSIVKHAAAIAPEVVESAVYSVPPSPVALSSYALLKLFPKANSFTLRPKVSYGIGVSSQIRFAHTDLAVPDWSSIRRDSCKDVNSNSKESAIMRKTFSYVTVAAAGSTAVFAGKKVVSGCLSVLNASKDVLAMAKVEIDLSVIPEGKSMVFKWTGKPLFIRHRTDAEVATEKAVDLSSLRDSEHDDSRVKDDKWLVVIGVCTHLGCVPLADAGDFGGYYCPCHGSHYDCSGRIRKGPAPLNLPIPPYDFLDDTNIVVG